MYWSNKKEGRHHIADCCTHQNTFNGPIFFHKQILHHSKKFGFVNIHLGVQNVMYVLK